MARTNGFFPCGVILLVSALLSLPGPICLGQAPALPQWDGDGGFDADYGDIPRLRWMGPESPESYQDYLERTVSRPFSSSLVYRSPRAADRAAGDRGQPSKALVLVESALFGGIQAHLDVYIADLENDGYIVEVHQLTGGTPASLKFLILNNAADLAGCVFVGDLPVAWFECDIWEHEEFPCDLFFMDLDGSWLDNDSDGMFDSHSAGSGDVGPEIFIGHIDTSMMSGDEALLTSVYLEKAHDYRSGGIYAPKYGLSYTEDDWASFMDMRTDIQYAYPEFDDIPAPATNRDDYVNNRVPSPEYELIQLCCHSSSTEHYFTRGGQASNAQIQSAVPHAMFYNLFCCSTLRFTSSNFLGGAYIYDTSQTSLAVIGSTKTGSMLTFSAFYQPLGAGHSYGESFRQWFNYLAPYSSEEIAWHYGMTIAGDPFLGMMESALGVTPRAGFESAGDAGGPFTPASMVYTLENHTDNGFDFSVSCSQPWITLSETSGHLAGNDTTAITVSISGEAAALPVGLYGDTISFINTTTHNGDTTREVTLQVGVPTLQYQWNMDDEPGWTAEGQWAHGTPGGSGGEYGNPDPTSGHSGTAVYGYNLDGDYPADLPETHLTSAAIDCSALSFVQVKFWRWLNVETPAYDHAYLRVSSDGKNWATVWENDEEITDSAWTEVEYDISAVADNQATVYLRWTMGSTDSGWQYSGWNIDDLQLWGFDPGGSAPTVDTQLACVPGTGTVPFDTQFSVSIANTVEAQTRRVAVRIGATLAGGSSFPSWRAGYTNVAGGDHYSTGWVTTIPALGAVIGENRFTVVAEDVTPPPYNQPPYPPSGDSASDSCTVTAAAP